MANHLISCATLWLILILAVSSGLGDGSTQCNNKLCIIEIKTTSYDSTEDISRYESKDLATIDTVKFNSPKLEVLPSELLKNFPNLRTLYVNNTSIKSIDPLPGKPYFSDQKTIKKIDFSQNRLVSLPNGLFGKQEQCETLNLAKNQLKTISEGAFEGLTSLRFLYLDHNQLADLPQNVFATLGKLNHLDLNHNLLTALDSNLYVRSNTLSTVMYDSNPLLNIIRPDETTATLQIRSLKLSKTNLTDIGNLTVFTKLTNLHLSSNPQLLLDATTFSILDGIQELFLHNMGLGVRPNQNLSFLQVLQYLDMLVLSKNNFSELLLENLPKLPRLTALDLSNNNLSNINYTGLKEQFPRLNLIVITNNSWPCDYLHNMTTYFNKTDGMKVTSEKNRHCVFGDEEDDDDNSWFIIAMMLLLGFVLGTFLIFLITLFMRRSKNKTATGTNDDGNGALYMDLNCLYNSENDNVQIETKRPSFSQMLEPTNLSNCAGSMEMDETTICVSEKNWLLRKSKDPMTDPTNGAYMEIDASASSNSLVADNDDNGQADGAKESVKRLGQKSHNPPSDFDCNIDDDDSTEDYETLRYTALVADNNLYGQLGGARKQSMDNEAIYTNLDELKKPPINK